MDLQKLFIALLLWIIPFTISAQRSISGRITDAESGDPVPGVSVFIAGTTLGMFTDNEGYYRLAIPGTGSYRLAAAHAAYQPVFIDIEPGQKTVVKDIKMQICEIEEVTVVKKVKFRNEDINLFWKTILGKGPSKRGLYATNPQAPYFYYNSEINTVTVYCREPLIIINNETGYNIFYVLKNFVHDYNSKITFWKGEFMFEEQEPKNMKERYTWEQNRKKVYSVSITNFIRSLFCDSLPENGFSLYILEDNEYIKYFGGGLFKKVQVFAPLFSDSLKEFLYPDESNSYKTLQIPASTEIMLVCFGKPVKKLEKEFISNSDNLKFIGLYRSEFHTVGDSIRIFPDGTFEKHLSFSSEKYFSEPLTGLNMTLPLDYAVDSKKGTISNDEE